MAPPLQLLTIGDQIHHCDLGLWIDSISGAMRASSNLGPLLEIAFLPLSIMDLPAAAPSLPQTLPLLAKAAPQCLQSAVLMLVVHRHSTVSIHFPAAERELYPSAVESTKLTSAVEVKLWLLCGGGGV